MTAQTVLFFVFAACTIGSAGVVIVSRNPVAAAMALVATFFFLAGIYVLLLASTIAVLQVLVYAGAIMVLFLFVIMLLALDIDSTRRRPTVWQIVGGLTALGVGASLTVASWNQSFGPAQPPGPGFGSIERLGRILYTSYLFPFEAVSLLLLVAIVGAVVVAKARI